MALTCSNCATPVVRGKKYCTGCGYPVDLDESPPESSGGAAKGIVVLLVVGAVGFGLYQANLAGKTAEDAPAAASPSPTTEPPKPPVVEPPPPPPVDPAHERAVASVAKILAGRERVAGPKPGGAGLAELDDVLRPVLGQKAGLISFESLTKRVTVTRDRQGKMKSVGVWRWLCHLYPNCKQADKAVAAMKAHEGAAKAALKQRSSLRAKFAGLAKALAAAEGEPSAEGVAALAAAAAALVEELGAVDRTLVAFYKQAGVVATAIHKATSACRAAKPKRKALVEAATEAGDLLDAMTEALTASRAKTKRARGGLGADAKIAKRARDRAAQAAAPTEDAPAKDAEESAPQGS